ncbi:thiamine phosphate synthase [Sphingobacterium chuzhouense]|uniref:Thiamine-phosphate synthase n=1 Tax=Sphingobacterium chuzhouense TaxID=1742264 RepID=A0ABR7XQV2_9SPHI|nr:thiamine phosphate synthase [Sphingobacterium chuzhouense]MBD1421555.1 thiamine phosphate synthase [Sphingobacterium chuzhouense]
MKISKLQYISQGITAKEQAYNIRQALDHGADWIQLRWKMATDEERLKLAERVRRQCQNYQAIFIINDSIAVAKQIDADGVHLGLDDEGIEKARKVLGQGKIIGGTANTITDVTKRIHEGCDYIGLGPYRATNTKEKLSPILGLEGYRNIIQYLKNQDIHYPPIYAIGGVGLADIQSLLAEGIYGVAVSKAIAERPTIVSDFKKILE